MSVFLVDSAFAIALFIKAGMFIKYKFVIKLALDFSFKAFQYPPCEGSCN